MMTDKKMELKSRITEFAKKNAPVLLVAAVGIILLLLPSGKDSEKKAAGGTYTESAEEMFSLEDMERKLEDTLSSIQGAGEVKVMLTLKSGSERIIAENRTNESSSSSDEGRSEAEEKRENSAVILDIDGSDSVVTVKYIYPEYKGAVIVAGGAGNAAVKLKITQAVIAATGLSIGNITVVDMKN